MEDLKEKGLKIYNAIFQGEKSVEIDEIQYQIIDGEYAELKKKSA